MKDKVIVLGSGRQEKFEKAISQLKEAGMTIAEASEAFVKASESLNKKSIATSEELNKVFKDIKTIKKKQFEKPRSKYHK